MSNSRRQQIYDRIRQSSKQEYILDEMIRLGFWAPGQNTSDPVQEVRRRSAIERELRALTTEQSRLHNVHALVREAQKQRLAESRRKRKETKERRLRERHARAQQWRERKKRELLYLGEQVSGGLSQVESDRAALEAAGLPLMARPADMARQMGVSVSELRFLAWNRSVSAISHYKRFTIPKRRGGRRLISAPMPRLKRAQRWILDHVLTPITVHEAAHGFRSGRSIVTNAAPHVGAAVVVNMDLRDFFPTLTFRRVRGAFGALGYSGSVATVLALLCTEPDTEQVQLDGNTWHVALGPRHLPQGAPTSPALTNIICRRLDRRLTGLAQELGFVYTRYADDLTFSKPVLGEQPVIGRLLGQAGHIIEDEGFVVHPDKTRVLRNARQQEVTGLVVNDKLGVPRKTLRRFRALLHHVKHDGPEGKVWNGASGEQLFPAMLGFACFVHMVDPAKGAVLRASVQALMARYGFTPTQPLRRPQPPTRQPIATTPVAEASEASGVSNNPVRDETTSESALPPETPETSAGEEGEASDAKDSKKKWWKLF